jgi:hypothetical protein
MPAKLKELQNGTLGLAVHSYSFPLRVEVYEILRHCAGGYDRSCKE